MKLYEYQAKARLAAAGVPVLPGRLCATPAEAAQAAASLGGAVVVKAQVLAGGRGKAGGIRPAATPAQAAAHAADLLGRPLLGQTVPHVWLEPQAAVRQELYLAMVLDTAGEQVLCLLGPGGVDVEAHPEAIWRTAVDPLLGVPLYTLRDALLSLGLPQTLARPLHAVNTALLQAFRDNQATLAEINPLAVTDQGLVALDARLLVDDSAIESLPAIADLVRERPDLFPEEHLKLSLGFDYVEINPAGNVGILSTGAGLTMTLIDLIHRQGGQCINFSDLRTGSMGRDPTRLIWVLDRLTQKPNLRAVICNIFAGITNLEEFAHALLAALQRYPALAGRLVVRATGTGFPGAQQLWQGAGVPVTEDLETAIRVAVEVAGR